MRILFALLVLAMAGSYADNAQAQSQSRWCAEYGAGNGGRNCGFSSLRQCRAAISGDNTGTCVRSGYSGRKHRR